MKFLLFLLFISSAMAAPLDEVPCSIGLKALASEWKAREEWTKELMGGPDNYFYAAPTDVIGEWVVFKKIPEGAVISKVSESGRIEAAFKGQQCSKEVKTYTHDKPDSQFVHDDEIRKFVETHKKGVIYVWSPRMILSQKSIPDMKKATKKMNLPILILLEKNITGKELLSLEKELGKDVTRRVDSLEFKMRRVEQHYPATMVFKDAKILSGVKYGYEKSARFELELNRMLGSGGK